MNITANGKPYEIEENTTIPQFLDSIDFALERVVIEYNKEALTQSEARETILQEGDSMEIIRIVAGG